VAKVPFYCLFWRK